MVKSNMWVIRKTIAESIRDFIFDAGIVDIKNNDVVKIFVKMKEDRVEAIQHSVLQATGTIDLADQKWQMRRRPAAAGVVTTLTNVG
jgi:hypothetical protein